MTGGGLAQRAFPKAGSHEGGGTESDYPAIFMAYLKKAVLKAGTNGRQWKKVAIDLRKRRDTL